MNCLYSTCRLTLIPDGWSTNRKLADYFRVARDSPKISGSAAELPFFVMGRQVRTLLQTGHISRNPRLREA
jgi:hypothetical protein